MYGNLENKNIGKTLELHIFQFYSYI